MSYFRLLISERGHIYVTSVWLRDRVYFPPWSVIFVDEIWCETILSQPAHRRNQLSLMYTTWKNLAWHQAPHCGKKEKKSASEASREVVWGGERAFPRPSPGYRWPILSFLFDPGFFLPFSTLWSLVPGQKELDKVWFLYISFISSSFRLWHPYYHKEYWTTFYFLIRLRQKVLDMFHQVSGELTQL